MPAIGRLHIILTMLLTPIRPLIYSDKLADVTPIFKSGDNSIKENFHPIIVLSSLSKIYERVLLQQILPFMVPKFSNLLYAFRESHSPQHALIRLAEQCRRILENKGIVGMVLIDLSKAFDCISHELLVAKLEAMVLEIIV